VLHRRALAIDEASHGPDHPDVANRLNNLATLLQATNRLGVAEPLSKRTLQILLRFTQTTGHEHPHLRPAFANYRGLLSAMGRSPQEMASRLEEIARPFGISFERFAGAGAQGRRERKARSGIVAWCREWLRKAWPGI